MLMTLISAHLVIAVVAPILTRVFGQRVFWVAALAPAISFAWLLSLAPDVLAGVAEFVAALPPLPDPRREAQGRVAEVRAIYGRMLADVAYRIENAALFD